jgi:biopolymer transport protein ExbD
MAELNQSSAKPGNRRSTRGAPPRVDLTAMVDLAFLLITFFMLTTSLAKPRSMPIVMPSDGPAGPVGESSTMSICLGKNNQALYYLGMPDKPLTTPKLTGYNSTGIRAAIIEMSKHIAETSHNTMMVVIKPSQHSVYDNLVNVLDEINITKVPSYAIAKITSKDVELLKQNGIY